MSVKFKNLAQAELCATLEILLQAEGKIREAAKNGNVNVRPTPNTNLSLVGGVCFHIHTRTGGDASAELDKLNRIYADLKGTNKHYPVPAPEDFEPDYDNYGCNPDTDLSEQAFDCAGRNDMWGEGEYAQNRWDYIRWLVDYMKVQQHIKEL